MFAFDEWAEWLAAHRKDLQRDDLQIDYRDTRAAPECASNPAFSLEITAPCRLGSIRIWRVGLCDFDVLETSTGEMLANESMLEANDETVPRLVAQFLAFFEQAAKGDGA